MIHYIEAMLDSVEPQLRGKFPNATNDYILIEAQRHRDIIFSMIMTLFCRYMKSREIHPAIANHIQKTKHHFFRKPKGTRDRIRYFQISKAS